MKTLYTLVLCLILSGQWVMAQQENALMQEATDSYAKSNFLQSIENCDKALRLNDKNVSAFNIKGLSYLGLAQSEFQKNNSNEATRLIGLANKSFSSAINILPNDKFFWYNRGYGNLWLNKSDLAIPDFDRAISLDSTFQIAWRERGRAYLAKENFGKGVSDLSKAIELNPKDQWANYFLGEAYGGKFLDRKALPYLDKTTELCPDCFDAFMSRAIVYTRLKEFDKAQKDLSRAIAINPSLGNTYRWLGIVYTDLGRYNEAVDNLKTAIAKDSSIGSSYLEICIPLIQLSDYKTADFYFKKYQAARTIPTKFRERYKFLETYVSACINNVARNEWNKALLSLQESVKQYSDYNNTLESSEMGKSLYITYVFTMFGTVYEKLNEFALAKNYHQKALQINETFQESLLALYRLDNKSKNNTAVDKTPPKFRLISPKDTILFQGTERATIIGKAADENGIAWVRINGVKIEGIEEDGIFQAEITRDPKNPQVAIEVQDLAGNITKKNLPSMVTRGGIVSAKNDDLRIGGAKFYALFISAENYLDPSIMTLKRPQKDAQQLKNTLLSRYTFNEADISMLHDKSREDILEAISTTVEKMGPNDNLLIFYAGHGDYKKGLNESDIEGYLLPVTAKKGKYSTYISAADISTAIKNCRARHVLLLTDACYSGSLVRRSIKMDAAVDLMYQYKSRQLMASGNLEPVPDESKFVYYLTKRLEENTDNVITADELFQRLKTATINNTGGKTLPVCTAMLDVGDEGGQFVFIKK